MRALPLLLLLAFPSLGFAQDALDYRVFLLVNPNAPQVLLDYDRRDISYACCLSEISLEKRQAWFKVYRRDASDAVQIRSFTIKGAGADAFLSAEFRARLRAHRLATAPASLKEKHRALLQKISRHLNASTRGITFGYLADRDQYYALISDDRQEKLLTLGGNIELLRDPEGHSYRAGVELDRCVQRALSMRRRGVIRALGERGFVLQNGRTVELHYNYPKARAGQRWRLLQRRFSELRRPPVFADRRPQRSWSNRDRWWCLMSLVKSKSRWQRLWRQHPFLWI